MAQDSAKKVDLNMLGQAMDATWGRSSASSGPAVTTRSVKAKFVGDGVVKITYTAVVNMVRERELQASCRVYETEADTLIEAAAKKIVADYKELSGESLKLKRTKIDTNVEIIDLNHFNQKRTAYFRRVALFQYS